MGNIENLKCNYIHIKKKFLSTYLYLLDDAIYNRPNSIYSTPFYVFPYGYKMCMRLYINGDSKTKNTHMSLFYVIMRGKYDDDLQWPFKYGVTFSLIDQSIPMNSQNYVSDFCWPDTNEQRFKYPISDMNEAFGIPKFISLNFLETNQNRFYPNDTMYIKIEINLLTKQPGKQSVSNHQ